MKRAKNHHKWLLFLFGIVVVIALVVAANSAGQAQTESSGNDNEEAGTSMPMMGSGMGQGHGMGRHGRSTEGLHDMMHDFLEDLEKGRMALAPGHHGQMGMKQGHRRYHGKNHHPRKHHGHQMGHMMGGRKGGQMMHQAQVPTPMGGPVPVPRDLNAEDVQRHLESLLHSMGNPRMKLGNVVEQDDQSIVAEVVTPDGSLVQRLSVNRTSGAMRQIN